MEARKVTGIKSILVFDREDLKGSPDFRKTLQKVKIICHNREVKVFFIKTKDDFAFCFEKSTEKDNIQIEDSFELAYYYASDNQISTDDIFRFEGIVSFGNKQENQFSILVDKPFIPKKYSDKSFETLIKEMNFPDDIKTILPLIANTIEKSTIF
ncbi:MAG TPA: hypothetical protein PKZ56_00455 [Candidatus Paceibacterota bacterium]|nr:hypothetical protein [Candidatus Paceibacterota bacterium]